MNVELSVVWDGTRDGRQGGYLVAEPETWHQPEPESSARRRPHAKSNSRVALDKLLQSLAQDGPQTARELSARLRGSRSCISEKLARAYAGQHPGLWRRSVKLHGLGRASLRYGYDGRCDAL